ncbi:MAG: hypothetical protein M0R50_06030 [Candidatus Cloacimonetes bacterium]|nr:hypothetical protein [Candidatus Cloacimonadota bacterium]
MLATRANRIGRYNPKTNFNRGLIAQTGFMPEGQQLLQDTWPLKVLDTKHVIGEGVLGGTPITRITGIFQVADDMNANGRIYPRPVVREAVEAIQEDLAGRSVWGEFDHPADAKIHLDRISHLLTKVWMEGKNVFGEAEIIDELPFGQQLKTLIKRGRVGISSRGIGDMDVRDQGGQETYYVTEGYRFVTWDAVAEPSVTGAILHICEGKLKPLNRTMKNIPSGVFTAETYQKRLAREISEYLSKKC